MKPKKTAEQQDWHRADIKAALEKSGWSLRQLATANGYHPDVFKKALANPYPKIQGLIAAAIAQKPQSIWPSRYNADGTAKRLRRERQVVQGAQRAPHKSTTQATACNVEFNGAN